LFGLDETVKKLGVAVPANGYIGVVAYVFSLVSYVASSAHPALTESNGGLFGGHRLYAFFLGGVSVDGVEKSFAVVGYHAPRLPLTGNKRKRKD
jgi:hypothetical protein